MVSIRPAAWRWRGFLRGDDSPCPPQDRDGGPRDPRARRSRSFPPACSRRARPEAWISGGLEAAAANPLGHVTPPARGKPDLGPHGVAIGGCTLELERDEMASPSLIVEIDQRLVLGNDHGIHPAVAGRVARGEPPAQMQGAERRTGLRERRRSVLPSLLPTKSCNGMVKGGWGRPS